MQRGQLKNHPVDVKKNVTKSEEKKITNSIKLDLPSCPLEPINLYEKIH